MKLILFLLLSCSVFAQVDSVRTLFNQRTQQTFVKLMELEVLVGELKDKVDSLENYIETHKVIYPGWEIDSAYINARNEDGSFKRRESGSYLYWKADSTGKLIRKENVRIY